MQICNGCWWKRQSGDEQVQHPEHALPEDNNFQHVSITQHKDRTPGLPGSDKNRTKELAVCFELTEKDYNNDNDVNDNNQANAAELWDWKQWRREEQWGGEKVSKVEHFFII